LKYTKIGNIFFNQLTPSSRIHVPPGHFLLKDWSLVKLANSRLVKPWIFRVSQNGAGY
jgi:hypothetical protein